MLMRRLFSLRHRPSNCRTLVESPRSSCELAKRDGATGFDETCLGVHPLMLGRSVLTQLRIYIATHEKVLYFTRAEAGL